MFRCPSVGLFLVAVGPFRASAQADLEPLQRRLRVIDDAITTLAVELASFEHAGPAPVTEKVHVIGRPRRKGWSYTYVRARHVVRMESQLNGATEELPLPQLLRRPAGIYFIDSDGDLSRAVPMGERAARGPGRSHTRAEAKRRDALI